MIVVIGCSNTGMIVEGAKRLGRKDLYKATFFGGSVFAWADLDSDAKVADKGWPVFEACEDPTGVLFQLCSHGEDYQSVLNAARQVVYMVQSRTDAPIWASGINGYDPPRDSWPKNAVGTIATNQAAKQLVADGLCTLGPDFESVKLLPSECQQGGLSPHPQSKYYTKLGAPLAMFDFGV